MERCQKSQLSLCLPVVMSGYSGLLRYVCFLQDSMTTVAMVSLGQFASALFNSQLAVKEECSELEDHIYFVRPALLRYSISGRFAMLAFNFM